jgi:hypothetical protein
MLSTCRKPMRVSARRSCYNLLFFYRQYEFFIMRVPRIYTSQNVTSGQILLLEEASSHHLSKVLRMQPGRELILFNGQGGEFEGRIQKKC